MKDFPEDLKKNQKTQQSNPFSLNAQNLLKPIDQTSLLQSNPQGQYTTAGPVTRNCRIDKPNIQSMVLNDPYVNYKLPNINDYNKHMLDKYDFNPRQLRGYNYHPVYLPENEAGYKTLSEIVEPEKKTEFRVLKSTPVKTFENKMFNILSMDYANK